jgi:hypothetical protein
MSGDQLCYKAPATFRNPPLPGVDPWATDQLTYACEGAATAYYLRGVLLDRFPTAQNHKVRVLRAIRRFDPRLDDLYVAQRVWANRIKEDDAKKGAPR